MRVITCFVASAFDRDDVDRIYDKAIKPILRELKIRCARVDRVEHNDDIDDKIFALMDAADFCIADLTYARPSVYYEAGYVLGQGKPVVYLARSDHFKDKAADPEGNLKVHFDLQMKNIISWSEPNNAFRLRLRRRIVKVIGPQLKRREAAHKAGDESRAFKLLPISEQLASLRDIATRSLRAAGYSTRPTRPWDKELQPRRSFAASLTRRVVDVPERINIIPSERVSAKQISEERAWSFLGHVSNDSGSQRRPRQQHYSAFIHATLRPSSEGVLKSALPTFRSVAPWVVEGQGKLGLHDEHSHLIHFALIPNVQSREDFTTRFNEIFSRLSLLYRARSGLVSVRREVGKRTQKRRHI
jgi:hypothetical protein